MGRNLAKRGWLLAVPELAWHSMTRTSIYVDVLREALMDIQGTRVCGDVRHSIGSLAGDRRGSRMASIVRP